MHSIPRIALLAVAVLVTAAAAAPAADVYVVHGIPGDDLGLATPLPVDVTVNGECLLTGFAFGDFAGPVDLPRGDYSFEVRLSDGNCTGGVAASLTTHTRGDDVTIVAHLDAAGAPVLTKFVNDDRELRNGYGRVFVRHAAAAPAVDVTVERGKKDFAVLDGFANGEQRRIALDARKWKFNVFPSGSTAKVAGPLRLTIPAGVSAYAYAVGSLANGTFQVLLQAVDLP